MKKTNVKAINEIGFNKTVRFLIYSFFKVVYHQLIDHLFYLPPARKILLKILGAKIGTDTILMNVHFFNWHHTGPAGLKIGKQCFLGDETLIDLYDKVVLEDHVTIAQRVTILTHLNVGYKNHPLQKYFPKESKMVHFKKGSVIGANSTILPGIIVGEESFIAAGSVVTKNVPNRTLCAGVPAKVIRKIK